MGTTHERFVAEITAKTSGAVGPLNAFDKQVQKSEKGFDKFAKSVGVSSQTLKAGLVGLGGAALGAGLVNGLKSIVTGFAEAAKAAGDLAASTGGTVQEVSAMQAALKDAGVSAEKSAGMLTKFTTAAGTQKGAAALKALNVELARGPGGAVDYAATMVRAADAITQIGDSATRNARLVALFGRAGAQAFQDLQASGLSLSEAMESISGNRIFTDADVKAARDYDDAMDSLSASGEALGNALGRSLVPALNGILQVVNPVVEGLAKVPPQLDAIAVAGAGVAGIFLGSNPLGWTVAAVAGIAALAGSLENNLNQQLTDTTKRFLELRDAGLDSADAMTQAAKETERASNFFQNAWAAIKQEAAKDEAGFNIGNPLSNPVTDALRQGGADLEQYKTANRELAASARDVKDAVDPQADAMKTLNDAIAAGVPDIQAYRSAVADAAEAQAANEANTRAATDAVDAFRAANDLAWQATLNLVDAEYASADAHQALINGINAVSDARGRAAQAEGRASAGPSQAERDRVRAQIKDAERDLKSARGRVRDARKDMRDAFTVGELADAKSRLRAAQKEVDEAQKRRSSAVAHGPTAADRASAREAANQARQDARDAEDRVVRLAQVQAAAVVAQAKGLAQLKGQTMSLADEHDLYIKSLQESKKLATTDKERASIQKLIDKLKEAQKTAKEGIVIGGIRFKTGTSKKEVENIQREADKLFREGRPLEASALLGGLDKLKVPVEATGLDVMQKELAAVAKPGGKDRTAKVNAVVVGDEAAKQTLDDLAKDRTAKITYSVVPPTTTYPFSQPQAGQLSSRQAMPSSLSVAGGRPGGAGVNYSPTIVNNYPKPERASDSVASSLRVARYLAGV